MEGSVELLGCVGLWRATYPLVNVGSSWAALTFLGSLACLWLGLKSFVASGDGKYGPITGLFFGEK